MGTNPPGYSAYPQHQKSKYAACWVMCCGVCLHLHVFTTSVTFLYDSGACIKCKKPYIITHTRVVSFYSTVELHISRAIVYSVHALLCRTSEADSAKCTITGATLKYSFLIKIESSKKIKIQATGNFYQAKCSLIYTVIALSGKMTSKTAQFTVTARTI